MIQKAGFLNALFAGFLLVSSAVADDAYHWPLDLPRVLTSSFAEYRPGRFHAGIDLSTKGVGRDVRAASDGYVARVRCSPYGYGKAVYLKLDDGNTAVYAHLDDFFPALRDYVCKAQHARKSYTVDLYPDKGAFSVRVGDIIGKSGQTGIGVPHLHYELRDPVGRPINPQLAGVDWPDVTRPVINRVLAVPRGPESTLNGDHLPLVLDVHETAPGEYACMPLRAQGEIGFAVDVIDPSNGGANRLGVRVLRGSNGGDEFFRVENDRISYATITDGTVAWHPWFLEEGPFALLYRWPGNRSENYAAVSADGWFTMPAGDTTVALEAVDFKGNTATVTVPLTQAPLVLQPESARGADSAASGVKIDCFGDWLLVTAAFTEPEAEPPVLVVTGPSDDQELAFDRVGPAVYRVGFRPPPPAGRFQLSVVHPRLPKWREDLAVFRQGEPPRTARFGEASLNVRDDSPYGMLFIRHIPDPARPSDGFPVLGEAVSLWPEQAPIGDALEISLPVPEEAGRAGSLHICRANGGGWSWLTTKRRNGRLTASTGRLGTFAVKRDDAPPTAEIVEPAAASSSVSRRPTIRARVSDKGSGIDSIEMTANGRWLLAAYDPERAAVTWEQDEELPSGRCEIAVRVRDRAGNEARAVREITISSSE